jgi:pimeloyl-ACP methyl ester carboxylesterase
MTTQSGFVELNGARLYYELAGAGEPVVFIHGFSLDARMWDDQFGVFAERYRGLRYDVRGFGRSSLPTGPYAQVEDLLPLLNHFQLAPAHVIGLSMGGGIALDFALMCPDATRSLTLVDAALGGFAWTKDWGAPGVLARTAGIETAKRAWLSDELFAPANAQPAVAARLAQMVADYSGYHWVNRDPGRWADLPTERPLEQLRAPTLALVGERDLPDFHRIAELVAARAPRAQRFILRGVGHMSNMEAPQAFNEVILRFLTEVNCQP